MDCSLRGSSVHGILQAKMLEWIAIPFSRESSQPRDQTSVSLIVGKFFTAWATRESPIQDVYFASKRMNKILVGDVTKLHVTMLQRL